jgi:hypothetical protein
LVRRFAVLGSALSLLALIGACKPAVISLQPRPLAFTPQDYVSVYDRWTRGARPFDFGQLRSVLYATATFESREFRWAYVVRYADDYGLATDARNAMLEASLADAAVHHRFFVTMGGGPSREYDLTEEEGAWRVLLMDDRGRQVRPIAIESLRRAGPAERAYFPSTSPFRRAFRVVFPAQHEDGYPTIPNEALFAVLRFTGPAGHVDLKWDFVPP